LRAPFYSFEVSLKIEMHDVSAWVVENIPKSLSSHSRYEHGITSIQSYFALVINVSNQK